jgi:Sodium:sulfate symporter transmembrane region
MESVAISRLLPSPLSHHLHLPPRSLRLSPPFSISASTSTSLRHHVSLHSITLPALRRRISSSLPPVHASASTPPPPTPDPKPQSTEELSSGAKLIPLVISVGIGLAVRFLLPKPVGVSKQAWQLLAIFMSTIAGLVLSPLPVGAWAFIGLTTSILTKTLSFSAFTNEVILSIPRITLSYPTL